jgi:16S rRNA (cytosine1402-N4)-methyltransferase
MDLSNEIDAKYIVNNYSDKQLLDIFYKYGEESLSKKIVSKIISNRPINTTLELVNVIKSAVGEKYFNLKHPERRIFQAIRIEVNKELEVLSKVLPIAIDLLNVGGRISVITFHSLEDRIVKQTFKKYSEVPDIVKGLPNIPFEYKPTIKLVNKKPIVASSKELEENSRSKSAKLRIIERI